ncbi:hypothetical protein BVRB_5g120060 [Beta vulgaris subsp. vulgaris]|nr:hypothetical protein BVRB_5g120060 [Beta vulgaris subsp. vulgaris]
MSFYQLEHAIYYIIIVLSIYVFCKWHAIAIGRK